MAAKRSATRKVGESISETPKQVPDAVSETTREVWYAGLGLLSAVEEEGSKLFNRFVEAGKRLAERGKEFEKKERETLAQKMGSVVTVVEEKVQSATEWLRAPRNRELKELNEKVDRLTEAVAELSKKLDRNGGKA